MTTDHRRLDAQTVQGILLDDPDFLREIVDNFTDIFVDVVVEYLCQIP